MWNKLSYDTQTTIVAVIVLIIVVGSVLLAGFIGSESRKYSMYEKYNNGICRDCGGRYEYTQALDYGEYLYICNGCNNAVELNKIYR